MNVGFYVKPEKWIKMNMEHLVEKAKKHGINIIKIDLDKNLEDQGPFDIIIHKSIDLFVQSNYFHNEKAKQNLDNFQNYIKSNPNIPIINPMSFDELATSRRSIENELKKMNFHGDCFVPDISNKTKKYIIKSDLACGDKSAHEFIFIDDEEKIASYKNDKNCIIQPFFETGNAVLKVYSIGSITKVDVKKPDGFNIEYDMNSIERIANVIRNALHCQLFGFDLIRNIENGKWYIIDLNSFSGIEVIPEYETMMIDFIIKRAKK